jgi:hypothetical protein
MTVLRMSAFRVKRTRMKLLAANDPQRHASRLEQVAFRPGEQVQPFLTDWRDYPFATRASWSEVWSFERGLRTTIS